MDIENKSEDVSCTASTGYVLPTVHLWQNQSFLLFWIGQTLSVLGDTFTYVALPLLVLQATGSVGQMGLITAIIGGSGTVTGLFAGWLADHWDRRRLMIFCDALRAVLYFALPLLWWIVGPQIWFIYVLAVLGACLGMIFQVTFGTIVVNLVDSEQIPSANGRLQTTFSLASVVGPMLAGVVCGLFHPQAAIAIDACSFLVSAISLGLMRLRIRNQGGLASASGGDPEANRERQRFWQTFLAGLRFIWDEPVLRALAILLFFLNLMNAGLLDILIFHLKHDLGQGDSVVGIVLGCSCVGGMIAGFVAPLARKHLGFGPCWIGGFGVYFAAIFLLGFSSNLPQIAGLVGLLTFTMTLTAICSISLRQQITPGALLGRVTSAFLMIVTTLAPIGAVLFTTLTARFGVMFSLNCMGTGGFILVCIALLTPIRQRYPERRAHARQASEGEAFTARAHV